MGHQSISMWFKLHYYQDTFTGLELKCFTVFDQNIVLKNFGKVNMILKKTHMGFELETCRFVVNALTQENIGLISY